MKSNKRDIVPESDCGNYPTPAPVAPLPKEAEGKAKELPNECASTSINVCNLPVGSCKLCAGTLEDLNKQMGEVDVVITESQNPFTKRGIKRCVKLFLKWILS